MPGHLHVLNATSLDANTPNPSNALFAGSNNAYAAPGPLTTLSPSDVSSVGGSQPHENREPSLVMNWCIALQGIFPSRN
jgi:microcystin-dependent protein